MVTEAARLMKKPSLDSPFGRAPEHASRLDLLRIETCSGQKNRVKISQMFSLFIRIYGGGMDERRWKWGPHGRGRTLGPRRARWPCGAPLAPLVLPRCFLEPSCSEKCIKLAQLFDLRRQRFSIKQKTSRKQELALDTKLISQSRK